MSCLSTSSCDVTCWSCDPYRVTIVKDREMRESKGVAFVLYVDRTSAHKAITALNRKELFGRMIRCSIARDNGRAVEFIRRKTYKDKTRLCIRTPHSASVLVFVHLGRHNSVLLRAGAPYIVCTRGILFIGVSSCVREC